MALPIRLLRTAAYVGIALLAFVITACGAGQVTQTSMQVTATGGAHGRVGTILVRDAQFVYPGSAAGGAAYRSGEDVPLQLTIVNDATTTRPDAAADRLVAVASPIARSGRVLGDANIGDGQVLTAGYEDPAPDAGAIDVALVGLTEPVRAGLTYPVVLTFKRAGDLRMELPVETPLRADAPRASAR